MTPQNRPRPSAITLNKHDQTLLIQWSDAVETVYPLSHLREACPCVECRGGHAFMGMEFAPDDLLKLTPKRSYALVELRQVGNYALCPVWDDGHATGIYSWEYLRHIAPQQP
jgi:DUF971 family protein